MKILVALDGSTYSQTAVKAVAEHLWKEGTEIRFITVETPWRSEFSRIGANNLFDDVNAGIRTESLGILNQAAAEIQNKTAGKLSVSTTLREGIPKRSYWMKLEDGQPTVSWLVPMGRKRFRDFS